jgi:hypothetical protein
VDRFGDTPFFGEHLLMLVHSKPPGGDFTVVAGDSSLGSLWESGKVRIPVALSIAAALQADSASKAARYGQHWLNTYTSGFVHDYKLFNEFIWSDPDAEAVNYETDGLEPDYFAEGMRIQVARSDWSDGAWWLYMRSSPHYADHTYDGQGGHFGLWKNGWLVKDHAFGRYESRDPQHNVVYLPPDADSANGMLWDEPTVLHRELTIDYVYNAIDASNVFSGPKVNCSLLFLRDGYLVVYDRIRTTGDSDIKAWQIFFEDNPVDAGGGVFSTISAGSTLFLRTLLPLDPVSILEQVDSDTRLRVSPATAAAYVPFLHVLQVDDGAPSTMATSEVLRSASGNMVGALMADAFAVLFSEDGSEITAAQYDIDAGPSATVRHHVTGLVPNASYTVTGPTGASGPQLSTDGGVLTFTTTGAGTVMLSN